jgi:hypothetical protein
MSIFIWIAVALVGLWLAARLFFKTVGCVIHVLLILAVIAIAWAYLGK